MKRIFVTGCGGMVGSSLHNYFKEKYECKFTDKDLNEDWLEFLDVRDLQDVRKQIIKFKPDAIIHLAALTSLEYAETHLGDAWNTNYLATKNIAEIANELDIPMVYISTAGIFDGKSNEYDEDSLPNPINVYGKTKLYGDLAVRTILKKYFIIRPGWMFGGCNKDKKFVSYIIKQIKEGRKELDVVNDKTGTPTYTYNLVKNIEVLLTTNNFGTYDMACLGKTNRLEIAKEILKITNRQDITIRKVDSNFFKKDFFVPRAECECIINKNLDKIHLNLMMPWKEALKHYIENDWKEIIKK